MEAEDAPRKYDVIVFGVTGFTGQFVAEELQRLATSGGLKWAVAGRNKSKVQAVLNGMKIMHLSMCRPPPQEGSGLYGGFDLTSGQIPPDGGGFCVQIPQYRGFLSPKQLHTSKQVIKESLLRKARFKSPSMGPTFQVKLDQIPPVCTGGGGGSGATH